MVPIITTVESLQWVNHASFVYRRGPVRLLCDPWLTGPAFNRSWRLISPTRFGPQDFAGITHLWFSHQHPDHFSPADLRAIPSEIRARITVLYHETIDKKVVRFCRNLRFGAVRELRSRRWFSLGGDVDILCEGWTDRTDRDSWLAIRSPESTLLNVNDCVIDTPAKAGRIAAKVGAVDVLLTQFSYADWIGNPEDAAAREAAAARKLSVITMHIDTFKPSMVVPFASFMWFSHEENFFLNHGMNRVAAAAQTIAKCGRTPVVLYPGDRWEIGAPHVWQAAAARYDRDLDAVLAGGPVDRSKSVPLESIELAMTHYLKRLRPRNPLLAFIPGLKTSVYLTDHERAYAIDLRGLREIPADSVVDVRTGSDSLFFALRAPWGANALAVNGRFTVPEGGDESRFQRFFRARDLNDHGGAIDLRWAVRQVARATTKRIQRTREAVG